MSIAVSSGPTQLSQLDGRTFVLDPFLIKFQLKDINAING